MARKKVSLAYITNDATRRATLKKRRRGLLKKTSELSILCNVSACAVIYSPQSDQAEAFPSAEEARRILEELGRLPETERRKKMVNQKTFVEQRVAKVRQQVRRVEQENKEMETGMRMRECMMGFRGGGGVEKLGKEEAEEVLEMLERKAKAVEVRMHQLGGQHLVLPRRVRDAEEEEEEVYDDEFAILMEEMSGSGKSAWEGFLPAGPY